MKVFMKGRFFRMKMIQGIDQHCFGFSLANKFESINTFYKKTRTFSIIEEQK